MSSPSVDSWVRAYASNRAPPIGEEVHEDTPQRRRILDRLLKYFLGLTRLDDAGRLASGDAIGSGAVEGRRRRWACG